MKCRYPILSAVGANDGQDSVYNPEAHLDTLRIMINEGQYDPMGGSDGWSVMHLFDGSPTVFQWLLDQDEFSIDYEQKAYGNYNICSALMVSGSLNTSSFLEAVLARDSDSIAGSQGPGEDPPLAHTAMRSVRNRADNLDFPKRIKIIWDAGVDFHSPDHFGETVGILLHNALLQDDIDSRYKYRSRQVESDRIPTPPRMSTKAIVEYGRLEDPSAINHRPRTPKSLWRTWFPGHELSILEVMQRHLDAWMEILLEAGLDLAEYGRREEELHPEGFLTYFRVDARVRFEYGDHVNGCRIHVTEIWLYGPGIKIRAPENEEESTSAEISTMPGTWESDTE